MDQIGSNIAVCASKSMAAMSLLSFLLVNAIGLSSPIFDQSLSNSCEFGRTSNSQRFPAKTPNINPTKIRCWKICNDLNITISIFPLKHAWKHMEKYGNICKKMLNLRCLLPGRSRSRIFLAKIRDGTRGLLPHENRTWNRNIRESYGLSRNYNEYLWILCMFDIPKIGYTHHMYIFVWNLVIYGGEQVRHFNKDVSYCYGTWILETHLLYSSSWQLPAQELCIKQNGEIEKPWIWDVGAISKKSCLLLFSFLILILLLMSCEKHTAKKSKNICCKGYANRIKISKWIKLYLWDE